MNMTMDKRQTSNMRRLRKGDMFYEAGELWEVTGIPEIIGTGASVRVPMKRINGLRSHRYTYSGDARVRLV